MKFALMGIMIRYFGALNFSNALETRKKPLSDGAGFGYEADILCRAGQKLFCNEFYGT